ncbi:phosphonate C-P lyase system protein PhnH [Pelagibius litoralis]|uniref:Phosphonate C-P lyase system protein PhnH n=2 Tax=Pelagibius litoralis TaxID=374515 RepID=A0A967KI07_9PROT|nr:phosphonate C-P lyase system protein PhnH [Pelagibius litoralis]
MLSSPGGPAGIGPAGIDIADLKPGLGDPVHDSQGIFRILLEAMARPGKVMQFEGGLDAPTPLDVATTAALLTLCDQDTPLWIDWIADTPPLRGYFSFHCGCPLVERSQEAAFALVSDAENMPRLALFAQGVDQYPDRSASLVIQLSSLVEGPATVLRGPGIRDQTVLKAAGLPDWFWNDWRLNAGQFPLGVDVFLTAGRSIVGLPRTVVVEA